MRYLGRGFFTYFFLLIALERKIFGFVGTGVSLADIQNHIMREIPALKERGISRDCIHMLMKPPRRNSTRACRYKELVDARVPGKKNSYREGSANQHFLYSRVAYREEFVSM